MDKHIKWYFFISKKELREYNAKDLKRKWDKFLKEQDKKNAERTKQGTV